MNQNNSGLFGNNFLDAITIVGFLIGIANYEENMSQSDMQDIIKGALEDIHGHLREQDEKLDEIMKRLEGKGHA